VAVEAKVQELQKMVGLDQLDKTAAKKKEEKIHGGFGDGHDDERYDKEQLEKGIKVEMEHTNDPEKAKEVVKDHLEETKDFKGEEGAKYYDKLDKMEEEFKEELTKKKAMLAKLIIIANKLDENGNAKAAAYIDAQIKKIADEFELEDINLPWLFSRIEEKIEKNKREKEAEEREKEIEEKEEEFELSCRDGLAADDGKKDVFEKFPGIKKHINNICESRKGHIDLPALIDIVKSRPEKLTDKDLDAVKQYVKEKIKEEKEDLGLDKDDDVIGLSETTTFVVGDEDDGNDEVFSKPSKV
jgi:hypothetical protein